MAERNTKTQDPAVGRLICIEEAVKNGFTPKDDWADWLKAGVKIVEEGGVVDSDWLQEFDRSNSYI